MPKILRILNRFNLGGPTYNAAYLTRYLAPEYETLLVAGMKDESEESSEFILRDMGLEPLYISSMHRSINPLNDLQAYTEIKKLILDFKPDIVHTHAAKAGALGRLAAHACKVPVVVHTFHGHVFHSYFGNLKTQLFISIERFLASQSNAIIAISKKQKEELVQQFHIAEENKVHVIPLGFDLNKFNENSDVKRSYFRKKYLLEEDEIAIGIVGRLVPVKNHSMFLSVVKRMKEKFGAKARFFIIGDGECMNDLQKEASEKKIDFVLFPKTSKKSFLTFTSWIKEMDVAMAGLDIVTLTSLNEGTPVSLIEAQAAGKPIVSTRTGGIEDVVLEGISAWLCENQDVNAFTDALLSLCQSKQKRMDMADKGKDFVYEKYSYQNLVNNTGKLYRKLLNQGIK